MSTAARGAILLTLALAAAPASSAAQKIFRRPEPLDLTITTRLGTLLKDRDSTERTTHNAELAYKDSAGTLIKVPITLRTRGHWRRQLRNCDFPPLKVEMTKEAARQTIFEGNRTLKLATSCRPSDKEYEQYILREFAVYRMYQAITPWSYRTRLAHITYQDSTGKTKPVQSWAFFVEDDGDLAQRRESKKFPTQGAYFDDLEPELWGNTQLFQYLIGNTDWSVSGLHNITLLRDSLAIIHAVPFDFDWTGAVEARYAFPDKSLPIHRVTDRLWRGDCRTAEELTPFFERFTARRAAMDSAYTSIEALSPGQKERMSKFFAEFWALIANPKRAAVEFKRSCSTRN